MKCSKLNKIVVSLVFFALAGCRQEEPNPELLDPIYIDLSKRATDLKKNYDDELKNEADLKISIAKAEPNSLEKKKAEKDLEKSYSVAQDLDQKARYYSIRSRRRMFEDRVAYKRAFAKNEQWPNPREYSDYQVNMRLQEAPRNWSARVPKLVDRLPSSEKSKEPAKGKEKKSEE